MAMVQADWIPRTLGLGFDEPWIWIIALAVGILARAAIGAVQGVLVAYIGIPAFIVTLGGLLVWRGLIFRFEQGQTHLPAGQTFQLLGGGPKGIARGDARAGSSAPSCCAGIIYTLLPAGAAAPALRLPGASDVGRGPHRRGRLRGGPRRVWRRQQPTCGRDALARPVRPRRHGNP